MEDGRRVRHSLDTFNWEEASRRLLEITQVTFKIGGVVVHHLHWLFLGAWVFLEFPVFLWIDCPSHLIAHPGFAAMQATGAQHRITLSATLVDKRTSYERNEVFRTA
jgi:hypothetical protein